MNRYRFYGADGTLELSFTSEDVKSGRVKDMKVMDKFRNQVTRGVIRGMRILGYEPVSGDWDSS